MRIVLAAASIIFVAVPAAAMPVSTFLSKAEALQAKGALALFSGDYRLLKKEITDSGSSLRAERLAAGKAGRKPAYCPSRNSRGMSVDEVLAALRAVPAVERPRTEVKDALRADFARRFPCRG